jgi:hypothetical protein
MLVDDRCSIYEDRPRACRTYDCRILRRRCRAGDADKAVTRPVGGASPTDADDEARQAGLVSRGALERTASRGRTPDPENTTPSQRAIDTRTFG